MRGAALVERGGLAPPEGCELEISRDLVSPARVSSDVRITPSFCEGSA
jgi:hypothetical protein